MVCFRTRGRSSTRLSWRQRGLLGREALLSLRRHGGPRGRPSGHARGRTTPRPRPPAEKAPSGTPAGSTASRGGARGLAEAGLSPCLPPGLAASICWFCSLSNKGEVPQRWSGCLGHPGSSAQRAEAALETGVELQVLGNFLKTNTY